MFPCFLLLQLNVFKTKEQLNECSWSMWKIILKQRLTLSNAEIHVFILK